VRKSIAGYFLPDRSTYAFFSERVVSFCLCVLIIERGGSVNEKKRNEWLVVWMDDEVVTSESDVGRT
jgi:hypothetical protein